MTEIPSPEFSPEPGGRGPGSASRKNRWWALAIVVALVGVIGVRIVWSVAVGDSDERDFSYLRDDATPRAALCGAPSDQRMQLAVDRFTLERNDETGLVISVRAANLQEVTQHMKAWNAESEVRAKSPQVYWPPFYAPMFSVVLDYSSPELAGDRGEGLHINFQLPNSSTQRLTDGVTVVRGVFGSGDYDETAKVVQTASDTLTVHISRSQLGEYPVGKRAAFSASYSELLDGPSDGTIYDSDTECRDTTEPAAAASAPSGANSTPAPAPSSPRTSAPAPSAVADTDIYSPENQRFLGGLAAVMMVGVPLEEAVELGQSVCSALTLSRSADAATVTQPLGADAEKFTVAAVATYCPDQFDYFTSGERAGAAVSQVDQLTGLLLSHKLLVAIPLNTASGVGHGTVFLDQQGIPAETCKTLEGSGRYNTFEYALGGFGNRTNFTLSEADSRQWLSDMITVYCPEHLDKVPS